MNNFEKLLALLTQIHLLLKALHEQTHAEKNLPDNEELLTRLQVLEHLKISDSTYRRHVKKGILKPMKMPGGHRYYKHDLEEAFKESIRRGRI